MILKRVEEGSQVKAIYESSNIMASTYNTDTKELVITFKRGLQYKYSEVPNKDYMRFELAESQGKVLNTIIKKYPFVKGETVDSSTIEREINEIIERGKASLRVDIVELMSSIVDEYKNENQFNDSKLNILLQTISKYKT